MEEYVFKCRRCKSSFEVSTPPLSRNYHLFLGCLTLGLWLVGLAFYQIWNLYRLSMCPRCGKRSRKLLVLFIAMVAGTAEISWLIFYFLELAPQQIISNASTATLPEELDLNSEISRDNLWKVLTFIWIVNILPGIGAYIAMNWPYILLVWFSIIVLIGLSVPSFYMHRSKP